LFYVLNYRYLPPEIGCLKNLEYLDLSFNKMKTLPPEICSLEVLISLKVANNKLVELPPAMTSLSRLESLDLSNNRLSSLGSLELSSMHRLQNLNLQVPIFDLLNPANSAKMMFF
jgi:Leucine-rich repeat (LRR) protein